MAGNHAITNPPEHVADAAERQLRALAIRSQVRDLALSNVDRIREAVAAEELR